jgi:hypothetical protein
MPSNRLLMTLVCSFQTRKPGCQGSVPVKPDMRAYQIAGWGSTENEAACPEHGVWGPG